jgi:predicted ATPase
MILRSVVIRRFKRFQDVRFEIPGHTVVVGPNNTGKTTLLQAIAAWDFGFRRWCELNDFQRHGGAYTYAYLSRHDFAAVPLRRFDLLWNDRRPGQSIEIEVALAGKPPVTMEFWYDTTEQIKLRPTAGVGPEVLGNISLRTVYIPPMTGLSRDEAEYARDETIDGLLAQGKPGDILRNLLVRAHQDSDAWTNLRDAMKRLFDADLRPPQRGAYIIAEYRQGAASANFDVASAGSGFQQVLMLLTFLHTRPGAILLVDEPDAHLHVFLQDAIYSELRRIAGQRGSQLILATHSEVIMDSVDAAELTMLFDQPRVLSETFPRDALRAALRVITHTDIMRAMVSPGVVYVEGRTDLDILREWAKILNHPLAKFLEGEVFWKPIAFALRDGGEGVRSGAHYKAIKLIKDMPAFELVDGDAGRGLEPTSIGGSGFQRMRWARYEIENYLFHPAVLRRFVTKESGEAAAGEAVASLEKHLAETMPPRFLENPLEDIPVLLNSKGREELIPPALQAAGLFGVSYTRFHEIASLMQQDEIHPEIRAKLDGMQKALGL